MSSFVPVEIQFACFALAVLFSFSLLTAIKVTEFANRPWHFKTIRWFCKQSVFSGLSARGWYATLLFLQMFGVLGIVFTIFGIPFPHSFFASFIVGCLWALYKQRN